MCRKENDCSPYYKNREWDIICYKSSFESFDLPLYFYVPRFTIIKAKTKRVPEFNYRTCRNINSILLIPNDSLANLYCLIIFFAKNSALPTSLDEDNASVRDVREL